MAEPTRPVTTLYAVLGIAQTIHQNNQSLRHAPWAPATGRGGSGISKARERRNDNVKCRAVFVLGMGKRPNELLKLQNRAGPSVNQHQGYGVGAGRALMDKIKLLSINFRFELIKLIDLRFLRQ